MYVYICVYIIENIFTCISSIYLYLTCVVNKIFLKNENQPITMLAY